MYGDSLVHMIIFCFLTGFLEELKVQNYGSLASEIEELEVDEAGQILDMSMFIYGCWYFMINSSTCILFLYLIEVYILLWYSSTICKFLKFLLKKYNDLTTVQLNNSVSGQIMFILPLMRDHLTFKTSWRGGLWSVVPPNPVCIWYVVLQSHHLTWY